MKKWETQATAWLAEQVGATPSPHGVLEVERHGLAWVVQVVAGTSDERTGDVIEVEVSLFTTLAAASADGRRDPYRGDGRARVVGRPRMRLRAETPSDVAGKRSGLNREIQTGDDRFDGAIYLESDAPAERVRAVLAAPEARSALVALCDDTRSAVRLHDEPDRLVVTRWLRPSEADARPRLDAALSAAARLVEALPLTPGCHDPPPRPASRLTTAAVTATAVATSGKTLDAAGTGATKRRTPTATAPHAAATIRGPGPRRKA